MVEYRRRGWRYLKRGSGMMLSLNYTLSVGSTYLCPSLSLFSTVNNCFASGYSCIPRLQTGPSFQYGKKSVRKTSQSSKKSCRASLWATTSPSTTRVYQSLPRNHQISPISASLSTLLWAPTLPRRRLWSIVSWEGVEAP